MARKKTKHNMQNSPGGGGVLGYILDRDAQVTFSDLKFGQTLLFLGPSFVQLFFGVPEALHYFFGSQKLRKAYFTNKI